ncbi:hypothetical protein HID58_048405, partial [Brassica napus]
IAPGGESLYYCLEPKVFIDLIQHCNLSSGDGPLLMLIGCGLLSRLRPFLPWSRSEYLHDLYESFVFLVLLAGLKSLHLVMLDVKRQYFSVPGLGELVHWQEIDQGLEPESEFSRMRRRSMTRCSCSLPPLGEPLSVFHDATLCFPLGEPLSAFHDAALCFPMGEPHSAFYGRHSMTRRLFLNLLCHRHREHVFSGFFYSHLLQMSRGYEDQHSLMRQSGSFPGPWAGFLSQKDSNGI